MTLILSLFALCLTVLLARSWRRIRALEERLINLELIADMAADGAYRPVEAE